MIKFNITGIEIIENSKWTTYGSILHAQAF